MGKQINYYMEFNDFRQLAQYALDIGCMVGKQENGKIVSSNSVDIVQPDYKKYFFYLPETEKVLIQLQDDKQQIGGYNKSGNVVIEANFSRIWHDRKEISRGRLFLNTGYYNAQEKRIDCPECMKKIYEQLKRKIKKTAPYTEMTDFITDYSAEDYKQIEWRHKEYITHELLELHVNNGYKLIA